MKRIIALVLAAMMMLCAFSGCGQSKEERLMNQLEDIANELY